MLTKSKTSFILFLQDKSLEGTVGFWQNTCYRQSLTDGKVKTNKKKLPFLDSLFNFT